MEFFVSLLFIFCIAIAVGMGVDMLEEGKKFRFGLAISCAVYIAIMLAKLLIT